MYHDDNAPLLSEYMALIGSPEPADVSSVGPGDALIIVDMQADFLLKDPVTNPHGGRFGAAEGDQCVPLIVDMIDHFATKGAYVIATRDYHPYDHASFFTQGGPYPPHCVQGTPGAELMPDIANAMARAIKAQGNERIAVCFKGMHEEVDSFGALPYSQGGHHNAPRNAGPPGLVRIRPT